MDGINLTNTIRPMQVSDFDRCIRTAQVRYAKQHPRLDYDATYDALGEMLGKPQFLLLTGRSVFFAAAAARSFMEPKTTVGALWMFTERTDVREFFGVIRAMERWGQEIGAISCGFGNISDRDFTAVAARLGYEPASQYFEKKLV